MSEAPRKPDEETTDEITSLDDEELLRIVGGNTPPIVFGGESQGPDWNQDG